MQSSEGITVSLSPVDIDIMQDALSEYILKISQMLEHPDMSILQRPMTERKVSQAKDLFHKISKKQ